MSVVELQPYLIDSREVDQQTWNSVRFIARAAFSNTILQNHEAGANSRTQNEIDYFVGWDDGTHYFDYMADPNLLVGNRVRGNQQYWNARLGLVSLFGELAGYIYAADNTSGSTLAVRWGKHQINRTNHLWIKSLAVHPKFQNNDKYHIGTELIRTILTDAPDKQPVSAYVLPEETPGVIETLQRHGFIAGASEDMRPFGPGSRPTPQIRMSAKSARSILASL